LHAAMHERFVRHFDMTADDVLKSDEIEVAIDQLGDVTLSASVQRDEAGPFAVLYTAARPAVIPEVVAT